MAFFRLIAIGDDIEIYQDEKRDKVITNFRMLRQQTRKAKNKANTSLADFVAPKSTGIADYMGAICSDSRTWYGKAISEFEKNHDDYNAIMLKALADRLAESFCRAYA